MTYADFMKENMERNEEERKWKAEVDQAFARNRLLVKIAKEEELQRVAEEQKGKANLEAYEFEAMDDWVPAVIKARIQHLYCEYCLHARRREKLVCPFCDKEIPRTTEGYAICGQGHCETLERLERRLWGFVKMSDNKRQFPESLIRDGC